MPEESPSARGISRAIQLYSVLHQQQVQQQTLARQRRRDTLEEEIRREDLKLRKRKDATAELKERQGELAKLDEEGARQLEPGEQPVTDIGDLQVPQAGGGYGTLPEGVGQMSVPAPSSRIVEVQGGGRFLRRPPEERFQAQLEREGKKQEALNTVILPQLGGGGGGGGGEGSNEGSGEGSGGGWTAGTKIQKGALPFLTGELSRRAATARQQNQQEFTAKEGVLNRTSRETAATTRETGANTRAETRETGANKRSAVTHARQGDEIRQERTARLVQEAASRAIQENEAAGGPPADALRNIDEFYQDDPIFRLLRPQIRKRAQEMLGGAAALKKAASDAELEKTFPGITGKKGGVAQSGGAARPRKYNAKGEAVEFDGTKWVRVP